jgi:ribose 5-phosphate isomerase A
VEPYISLKQQAADSAVNYIEPGMVIGLGHGSTAIFAIRRIAHLLKIGQLADIVAIPCSRAVEQEAINLGIPLTSFEQHSRIDVTIDGADEVDPNLDLIKGGGGALLREKIVAQATRREIIVVDERKLVPVLGERFAVPVEVVPFGWHSQITYLEDLGASWKLRRNPDESVFVTDQGNYILDCNFGPIQNPLTLAQNLDRLATVVEHGLFLNIATDVIVAGRDGIRHLKRSI